MTSLRHQRNITETSPRHQQSNTKPRPIHHRDITQTLLTHHWHKPETSPTYHHSIITNHFTNHLLLCWFLVEHPLARLIEPSACNGAASSPRSVRARQASPNEQDSTVHHALLTQVPSVVFLHFPRNPFTFPSEASAGLISPSCFGRPPTTRSLALGAAGGWLQLHPRHMARCLGVQY